MLSESVSVPSGPHCLAGNHQTNDKHGYLHGSILRIRVQGALAGKPFGLVTLATAQGEIAIRGEFPETALAVGDSLCVRVHRYVGYTDRLKVSEDELV